MKTSTIKTSNTITGVDRIIPKPGKRIEVIPFHHRRRAPIVSTERRVATRIRRVEIAFMAYPRLLEFHEKVSTRMEACPYEC